MESDYLYWLNLVTKAGYRLAMVPFRCLDYNICLAAVTNDGGALVCVPSVYQTFELLISIPDLNKYTNFIKWKVLDQDQIEFIRLKYGL